MHENKLGYVKLLDNANVNFFTLNYRVLRNKIRQRF